MILRSAFLLILVLSLVPLVMGQDASKRNDRPQGSPAPVQKPLESNEKTSDATRYRYEFTQPEFVIRHILIEHDAKGRGQITFERHGEETPLVEPIELSPIAWGRISAMWADLKFLDSNENYQTAKSFAHLGTYRISMNDGKRQRTAEFNWSNNKSAWGLANEYRKAADQAILIFNLSLAREMQPLNAPSLLNEMDSLLTRNGLSDPRQLIGLLKELRTDEHIPLIARNQADRILKKIQK